MSEQKDARPAKKLLLPAIVILIVLCLCLGVCYVIVLPELIELKAERNRFRAEQIATSLVNKTFEISEISNNKYDSSYSGYLIDYRETLIFSADSTVNVSGEFNVLYNHQSKETTNERDRYSDWDTIHNWAVYVQDLNEPYVIIEIDTDEYELYKVILDEDEIPISLVYTGNGNVYNLIQ